MINRYINLIAIEAGKGVHIHKGWGEPLKVKYYPNRLNNVCSVSRGLRIEEGSLEEYKRLAEFHYRRLIRFH